MRARKVPVEEGAEAQRADGHVAHEGIDVLHTRDHLASGERAGVSFSLVCMRVWSGITERIVNAKVKTRNWPQQQNGSKLPNNQSPVE